MYIFCSKNGRKRYCGNCSPEIAVPKNHQELDCPRRIRKCWSSSTHKFINKHPKLVHMAIKVFEGTFLLFLLNQMPSDDQTINFSTLNSIISYLTFTMLIVTVVVLIVLCCADSHNSADSHNHMNVSVSMQLVYKCIQGPIRINERETISQKANFV